MPEGTEVEQASTTQVESNTVASSLGKKQVNWVLVLILSIFLGQLGIDRFMMGQVGLGILKLITFGGFGIWWLIDVIMIATKHEFKGIEWV